MTATISAECDVPAGQAIVEFVHRLGGPVDVVGYDAEGDRVGVIVTEVSADEVEVLDLVGAAVRLVATPAAVDVVDVIDADGTPRTPFDAE